MEGIVYEWDWYPRTASGKQKTPGQIRGAIRKFLSEKTITQTEWLKQIGVNNNSFGRFMRGSYVHFVMTVATLSFQ